MAYDEVLGDRIREALAVEAGVTERKMFGGLGFMLEGHMAVAAGSKGSMMVRVAPEQVAAWVDGELIAPMEMRGRPVRGWLLVSPEAVRSEKDLRLWVDRGVAYVRTLPPK